MIIDDFAIKQEIIQGLKAAQKNRQIPVFVYARISSLKQEDGNSKEDQLIDAKNYALKNNFYIVYSFCITESAHKAGRIVFNQMISYAQYFNIKNLIFKNSDRMSRNLYDSAFVEDLVMKESFVIHLINMGRIFNKYATASDKMMMGVETSFNKHWSDKISEEVRKTNVHKADRGTAPCRSPYGYVFDKEIKQHAIDPKTESRLRYIFDEFDTGKYSLADYVDHLNHQNIKTPKGQKWSKGNIYHLLTRVFYHGEFVFHDEVKQGNHKPYYSKARYEKRLNQLNGKYVSALQGEISFQLAKFLKCQCGKLYTGDFTKNKYIYYKHACPDHPKQIYIPEGELFDKIDQQVIEIRYTPDFAEKVKIITKDILETERKDNQYELSSLTRKINEFESKKEKLLDLYTEDKIDKNTLSRRIDDYNKEIKLLEQQKGALSQSNDKIIIQVSDVIDTLRDLPTIYLNAPIEGKVEILRGMAEGILVRGTRENFSVQPQWKEPFKYLLRNEILEYQKSLMTQEGFTESEVLLAVPETNKKGDDLLEVRKRRLRLPRLDSNQRPSG